MIRIYGIWGTSGSLTMGCYLYGQNSTLFVESPEEFLREAKRGGPKGDPAKLQVLLVGRFEMGHGVVMSTMVKTPTIDGRLAAKIGPGFFAWRRSLGLNRPTFARLA